VAVHAWDAERALRTPAPRPAPLAADLLDATPRVVDEELSPLLFTPTTAVPTSARPGDRLVAFLGRDPDQ